jgi:hypothetical protein
MKYFLGLFLSVLSATANADLSFVDSIYTVVGFQCDAANDILLLTYDGAYGLTGENLVRDKKPDQWDLWSLYYAHQTIRKQCRLSDGEYELSISVYNTGSCPDCYGIWAKVTHGSKVVLNEGLHGFEGPPTQTVIAQAVIKSHDVQPELTKLTWDDFVERVRVKESTRF